MQGSSANGIKRNIKPPKDLIRRRFYIFMLLSTYKKLYFILFINLNISSGPSERSSGGAFGSILYSQKNSTAEKPHLFI